MVSPEMPTKQRRLYLWIGQDLYEQFVGNKESRDGSISGLFEELVRTAFEKPELRIDLEKFYQKHIEFFDQEEASRRVSLIVDELTVAFAKPAAFDILGTGNVSLLFRVLLRYYAVENKRVKKPPASSPAARSRANEQLQIKEGLKQKELKKAETGSQYQNRYETPVDVRTICTVNSDTHVLISRLAMKLGKKKMTLLRDLIEEAVVPGEDKLIQRFYDRDPDQFIVWPGTGKPLRLNLTTQISALLELFSVRLFDDTRNKSKAIRVIVAYFAKKYRVRL